MLDQAAEIDPPELRAPGRVAERAERDSDLDGPAVGQPPGPHPPDSVPVGVRVPLVGDLGVVERARRVGVKQDAVPTVVEGVEDDRETVTPADVAVVATHLVCPQQFRVFLFQVGGDVEAVGVVEHPDAGRFGDRGPLVGLLLHEPFGGRHLVVDGIVEHPVHGERFGESEGADRDPAIGVPADRLVRRGRRRAEDAVRDGRTQVLLALGEPSGTAGGGEPEVVLIVLQLPVGGSRHGSVLGGGGAGGQEGRRRHENAGRDKPPHAPCDQRLAIQDPSVPSLRIGNERAVYRECSVHSERVPGENGGSYVIAPGWTQRLGAPASGRHRAGARNPRRWRMGHAEVASRIAHDGRDSANDHTT